VLKAQADKIAAALKAVERGEAVDIIDARGKFAAARHKEAVKFAVIMDDKTLAIEIRWDTIRQMSETGIAEWILRYMRGARESVH
jgi:hypothetical protein